jgi:hypothetical protein
MAVGIAAAAGALRACRVHTTGATQALRPIMCRFGTATRHRAPFEPTLKHPFTRELHAYWTERRGERRAPERADIDPASIRRILGDSLVLSCDVGEIAHFRVAGTRLCALFGRELRGEPFASIWDADSVATIRDIVRIVAEEGIGVVAGASAQCSEDLNTDLEMLLLPLLHGGRIGTRLIGSLAPLTRPFWLGIWPATPLRLGSIKYVAPDADPKSFAGLHAQHPAGTRLTVIDGGRA